MRIFSDKVSLMVFNMQLDLIPLLHQAYHLTHACRWLMDLFAVHQLPSLCIEHKKLGALAPSIQAVNPKALSLKKYYFSILKEKHFMEYMETIAKNQVVISGAETHVCIYQSAIDLLEKGYEVFILVDATSARSEQDHMLALDRLKAAGCSLITKEMLFFELIDHSEHPNYLPMAKKFLDGRYIQ
jgi:isochorismate hydrolase